MRWKSIPGIPKKTRTRKINYEALECETFFAFIQTHYRELEPDLERHECGGSRGKVERAMLAKQGVKAGFPDFFFYYPSGKFHGLAIEMKKTMEYGGSKPKTSPAQLARLQRLRERGYAAYVCYGAEDAINILQKYLRCKNL